MILDDNNTKMVMADYDNGGDRSEYQLDFLTKWWREHVCQAYYGCSGLRRL